MIKDIVSTYIDTMLLDEVPVERWTVVQGRLTQRNERNVLAIIYLEVAGNTGCIFPFFFLEV